MNIPFSYLSPEKQKYLERLVCLNTSSCIYSLVPFCLVLLSRLHNQSPSSAKYSIPLLLIFTRKPVFPVTVHHSSTSRHTPPLRQQLRLRMCWFRHQSVRTHVANQSKYHNFDSRQYRDYYHLNGSPRVDNANIVRTVYDNMSFFFSRKSLR